MIFVPGYQENESGLLKPTKLASCGFPLISPTTAPLTRDLAGWTHPYDGSLMAVSESRVNDDHLQQTSWDSTSVMDPYDNVHTSWNDNTMSLNPFLPVPKDDGASLGVGVSGFAAHGDKEQSRTLTGGLEAEQWPYGYDVPVGRIAACRSNPRRKRRRFTNGEKAVINHKRKIGVCRDCRQAKRKASLVRTNLLFC